MYGTMAISICQINNVIKTYMKYKKTRVMSWRPTEDSVLISEEGLKRVLFDQDRKESQKHVRDTLVLSDPEPQRQ